MAAAGEAAIMGVKVRGSVMHEKSEWVSI